MQQTGLREQDRVVVFLGNSLGPLKYRGDRGRADG